MPEIQLSDEAMDSIASDVRAKKCILIVCRAKWEADEMGRKFIARANKGSAGTLTPLFFIPEDRPYIITIRGGGSVEFGWIETRSGRRYDDYDQMFIPQDEGPEAAAPEEEQMGDTL